MGYEKHRADYRRAQGFKSLAVNERLALRDGTIIREWHPQGRVPSRLGRRKTLTPFLLWRGPLVPTAPRNSSIGAGWITPASLRERLRIGVGLSRFTQKTGLGSWIIGGTYWLLGRPVKLKHACAGTTGNIDGSCSERSPCATVTATSSNGMARIRISRIVSAPRHY